MASIVERLRMKPDCWGLRWRVRRAADVLEAHGQKPCPALTAVRLVCNCCRWFLSLSPCRVIMITASFQSAGTFPDFHMSRNSWCRAALIGISAVFKSSGVISSGPAARPFRSFLIAFWTSSRVDAPSRTSSAGTAFAAASSSSGHWVAGAWFSVCW